MKIPNLKFFYEWGIPIILFVIIIYLAVYVRAATLAAPTVLDYDPWWYYRHAIEIMNNNYQPLKWDLLSYYPPGRPFEPILGWEYTMILFYKVTQLLFKGITFLFVAKASPMIMVALGTIPAYLFGRLLTNKWGGLITALFAVLTPTFIGVSMAGYSDNDPVVMFYTFLSALSILLALKKRSVPYYIFAVLTNVLFVYNWGGGWFILILFTVFLPALIVFRILEDIVHQKRLTIDFKKIVAEVNPLIIPLLIIIILTNIFAIFIKTDNILHSILVMLGFITPEKGLLVNISVAELQPINILTREGFLAVTSRIGLAPTLFTLIGLPIFVVFKLYKRIQVDYIEVFLFLWWLVTFYMILHGVRFSLQFSAAAAASAGYIIGHFRKYTNISLVITFLVLLSLVATDRAYLPPTIFVSLIAILAIYKPSIESAVKFSTIIGVALLLILVFMSNAIQFGYASTGMEVSRNWLDALDWLKQNADKDALITTWWDPGHIIAGYTGLKVHADGAHCDPVQCIPYNHNIRIQDMGRTFATSDENEAIRILQKYMQLTPQQCQEVKQKYGNIMPKDACNPVSEMYVIASNDLIGKFYWLSFFGTGTGRNFAQLPFSGFDATGNPTYGQAITLAQKDDNLVGIYNNKFIIREIVYFQNNQIIKKDYANVTSAIDGMLWVDPSFQIVIFMEPAIRDSIFTKMFFWSGEGLKNFELKYVNPEIRIYKVNFK